MFPTPNEVKSNHWQKLLHNVMKDVNDNVFAFWDGEGTKTFSVGASYNSEALRVCKSLLKKQGWNIVEKKTKNMKQWFISAEKTKK